MCGCFHSFAGVVYGDSDGLFITIVVFLLKSRLSEASFVSDCFAQANIHSVFRIVDWTVVLAVTPVGMISVDILFVHYIKLYPMML